MPDGEIRYLQIPATDVEASARFYASVFGWQLRTNSNGERAFDAGQVSGTWVEGRPPTREPGVLVWVRVDSVEAALERIANAGGEPVLPMEPQGEGEAIATFRDPAGNVLGVYAGADPRLSFELLNEPHDPLTADRWNALLREALAVVRSTNPARTVILGPVRWNIVEALPTLSLPHDEHLIVTAHYYSPFEFTHQGTDWLDEAHDWLGTSWGTDAEQAQVSADLEGAVAWASAQGRRLFLGELGGKRSRAMASISR